MAITEPIDCLAAGNTPIVFRWRGALYKVTGVIRSWRAEDDWWNASHLVDTKYWLVAVKDSTRWFQLRQDPDGRWWLLQDRAVAEVAA